MPKPTTKQPAKKKRLSGWIYRLLIILAVGAYVLAAYAAATTGLIPGRYMAIAIVVSGVVVLCLLAAAFRWRKSVKAKLLLAILFVALLLSNLYVYSLSTATNSLLQNISAEQSSDVDTTRPFVVYISGIDSDGDPAGKARSDVNILAVVNPADSRVLLVNTPRDYYVPLAGIGARDKLTHAGLYGVETSMETLSELYDVPVEYYLRINFTSLVRTIDVLGGVDVVSDNAFTIDGYSFRQGVNHLDGKAALAFSRERYSLEGGDRARGANQQRVIEAVIRKITSPSILANYQSTLRSLQGSLLTNMSSQSLQQLVSRQIVKMPEWEIKSISVTGSDSQNITYSTGSQMLYVMEPDQTSIKFAKQQIHLMSDSN